MTFLLFGMYSTVISSTPSESSWEIATEQSWIYSTNFLGQLRQIEETFSIEQKAHEQFQSERAQALHEQEESAHQISNLKEYLLQKEKQLEESTEENQELAHRNNHLHSELKSQKNRNHEINTETVLFKIQLDQAETIKERDERIEELCESVKSLEKKCSGLEAVGNDNANLLLKLSALSQDKTHLEAEVSLANEAKNEATHQLNWLYNKNAIETMENLTKMTQNLEQTNNEMESLNAQNHEMKQEISAFEFEQKQIRDGHQEETEAKNFEIVSLTNTKIALDAKMREEAVLQKKYEELKSEYDTLRKSGF